MDSFNLLLFQFIFYQVVAASTGVNPETVGVKDEWEEWTEITQCSRSCGGGVQHLERKCRKIGPDGQPFCNGPTRTYVSCNTQECPEGSLDFRLTQCQKYNSVPFNGKFYQWEPHYAANKLCELYCKAKEETFYYRHAAKVIDGTLCGLHSSDICVNGICQPVGCDKKLGSNKKFDNCMVCGGDGKTCKLIEGSVETSGMRPGYNELIVIPKHASMVEIHEEANKKNFLATKSMHGVYYLNGDFVIDVGQLKVMAGSLFEYKRLLDGSEYLTSQGPLTEELFVEVLKQPGNSSVVHYRYSLPLFDKDEKPQQDIQMLETSDSQFEASWTIGDWSDCVDGEQERLVLCEPTHPDLYNFPVVDADCPYPKPAITQKCDVSDVGSSENDPVTEVNDYRTEETASWNVGEWSDCAGGEQDRQVFCSIQRIYSSASHGLFRDRPYATDESKCPPPKPSTTQRCSISDNNLSSGQNDSRMEEIASWTVGEWSECIGGKQDRQVFCGIQRIYSSPSHGLHRERPFATDESKCSSQKPAVIQNCKTSDVESTQETIMLTSDDDCNHGLCFGYEWIVSDWSGCLDSCKDKFETRFVVCSDKEGFIQSDDSCEGIEKPETRRECPVDATCESVPQWHASQWGACSVKCGVGKQRRNVFCAVTHNDTIHKLPSSKCDQALKMLNEQSCHGPCDAMWFSGPYGKCSSSCKQTRLVLCFAGGNAVDQNQCDIKTRPQTQQTCNQHLCIQVPTPPQNLQLLITQEEPPIVTVSWQAPRVTHGNIDGYRLTYNVRGESYMEERHLDGDEQRFTTGVLDCGAVYEFHVAAKNNVDYGETASGVIQTPEELSNEIRPTQEPVAEEYVFTQYQSRLQQEHTTEHVCAIPMCANYCEYGYALDDRGCETCNCFTKYPNLSEPVTVPIYELLPEVADCETSEFGCCPDGVSPAQGWGYKGCSDSLRDPIPPGLCKETEYGCCADGITPAEGPNKAGCTCEDSIFGCCPDGITEAKGFKFEGCESEKFVTIERKELFPLEKEICGDDEDGSGDVKCVKTPVVHETLDCHVSDYGCCPDGVTNAHGPEYLGCSEIPPQPYTIVPCSQMHYGCCQDGESAAEGPGGLGCPETTESSSCLDTEYGCCLDGRTSAQGPNFTGCPGNESIVIESCDLHHFGCCLDGITPAKGLNFLGCQDTTRYIQSCLDSSYGCCPDGVTKAKGPMDLGCSTKVHPGAVCSLPMETGTCSNYTVKWYYDLGQGECTRFWYSGCDSNGNRFDSEDDCKATCVSPQNNDKCFLPKAVGRCRAAHKRFFYNSNDEKCEEFTYGGCGGNDNRFNSFEQCELECVETLKPDVCSEPYLTGPCRGSFERWYHDKVSGLCRPFVYGGCNGNNNRFETLEACQERCNEPVVKVCQLESDPGPCTEDIQMWYFNPVSSQCETFSWGGCQGNYNRFATQDECQNTCGKPQKKNSDICSLPHESGMCLAYFERWYHDPSDGYCKTFVYGGCGGNENRFDSESSCRRTCSAKTPQDVCMLPSVIGQCGNFVLRYYYDSESERCVQFYYSGCSGNGNNFETFEECAKRCTKTSVEDIQPATPLTTTLAPASDGTDPCLMSVEPGPCRQKLARWFYSSVSARCVQFQYGGCEGNQNRFMSEDICLEHCQHLNGEPVQPLPTGTMQMPEVGDVCQLGTDAGSCAEWVPLWYFDTNYQDCQRFWYGGCGGNGNRFQSLEECQHRCLPESATTVPQPVTDYPSFEETLTESSSDADTAAPEESSRSHADLCSLPKEIGPCKAEHLRFYWDDEVSECRPFLYSGCQGNENNFATVGECNSACGRREVVRRQYKISDCFEANDPGTCHDYQIRWFFDFDNSDCQQFYYGGCDGNENNFRSYEECLAICAREPQTCAALVCDLQCKYGFSRGSDGCEICKCNDPCEGHYCPSETECVLQNVTCVRAPCDPIPICLPKSKPGECPPADSYHSNTNRCLHECDDDAQCEGSSKCCSTSCGKICTRVEQSEESPVVPKSDVEAVEGDGIVIECRNGLEGDTSLYWLKDGHPLVTDDSADKSFNILPDGSLEFPNIRSNDSATYTCVSGSVNQIYEIKVWVPASMRNPSPSDLSVGKGVTIVLDCQAGGSPAPTISWFKEDFPVVLDKRFKEDDGSLVIEDVDLLDSGKYHCEVYNGYGSVLRKSFDVEVVGSISLNVVAENDSLNVGGTAHMVCNLIGAGGTELDVKWEKDGQQITALEERYNVSVAAELIITDAVKDDTGLYKCFVDLKSSQRIWSPPFLLQVNSVPLPANCIDKPWYANCQLIIQADLCRHAYFSVFCCKSCYTAGRLP